MLVGDWNSCFQLCVKPHDGDMKMSQTPHLLRTIKPVKLSVHSFTVYWKDGSREVIKGINIEDAFLNKGYKEDDVNKIDIIKNGIFA
jgi:hypothetical protein